MTDKIDNAADFITWATRQLDQRSHSQPILPGPVDNAVLLQRYEGTTALIPLQGVKAVCEGCTVRETARLPVGERTAEGGYANLPDARVVPPKDWQERSGTQPMLCPACLTKVAT